MTKQVHDMTKKRNLNLGLTAEQKENRKNSLGGSDANIIMSGDKDRISDLWEVKTGQKESENLDHILPVIMGQWTEELNLYWYEQQTDRLVTAEQDQLKHKDYDFMACTLDGLTTTCTGEKAIFEAKHVNQFSKIEDVVQRYMPQLHHNMAVAGCGWAVLSVFKGTLDYEIFEVEADILYMAQLIDQERKFWECVKSGEVPYLKTVETPKLPTKFRQIDMTGNNEWAALTGDYLDNEKAAKTFDKSKKDLKKLVEDDVNHAFGYGLQIKRAKNGNLSFSKLKGE